MEEVEASHFRTETDTGANPCAMLVWNALRSKFGLPHLEKRDLPFWYDGKYVTPADSKLLKNNR